MALTLDHDTPQVTEITGLSMAACAQAVVDQKEGAKAISVLDYSKGFGHTDLVSC